MLGSKRGKAPVRATLFIVIVFHSFHLVKLKVDMSKARIGGFVGLGTPLYARIHLGSKGGESPLDATLFIVIVFESFWCTVSCV